MNALVQKPLKFFAGQEFSYAGVQYRILDGDRCEGDLRIQFRILGWHQPAIAHTMILTAFKFQVEENNYGKNGKIKSGQGGWYLLGKIKMACLSGWESEAETIKLQREELQHRDDAIQGQLALPI